MLDWATLKYLHFDSFSLFNHSLIQTIAIRLLYAY